MSTFNVGDQFDCPVTGKQTKKDLVARVMSITRGRITIHNQEDDVYYLNYYQVNRLVLEAIPMTSTDIQRAMDAGYFVPRGKPGVFGKSVRLTERTLEQEEEIRRQLRFFFAHRNGSGKFVPGAVPA